MNYVDLMTRDYPKFIAALEGEMPLKGRASFSMLVDDVSGKMPKLAAKLFKDDIDKMMKWVARFCIGCSKKTIYEQAALKVLISYG